MFCSIVRRIITSRSSGTLCRWQWSQKSCILIDYYAGNLSCSTTCLGANVLPQPTAAPHWENRVQLLVHHISHNIWQRPALIVFWHHLVTDISLPPPLSWQPDAIPQILRRTCSAPSVTEDSASSSSCVEDSIGESPPNPTRVGSASSFPTNLVRRQEQPSVAMVRRQEQPSVASRVTPHFLLLLWR